jgi:hypothetical protein
MMVHRITRWSLSTTMLFGVSGAAAQTNNPASGAGGGGKFRAACGEDVQRFCVGVQPGGGRFVQCLSSHTSELSAACGNMIAAIQARRGTSNPSAQSPATQPAAPVTVGNSPATIGSILRASCGPDVQRLCAGARRESEVLKCLDSQRMELSPTCSLYFQKMGAQPTAQRNAPNKKPASPPTTQIPVQKKKPPSQPPTMPIPVQENAPNEQPLSPPPIAPNRAQENAPSEKPTSPPPVQENAPNKKPQPPPTTPIPD